MTIKPSQLFGWEHEPAQERPSAFMNSTSFASLSGYHANLGFEGMPVAKPPPNLPAAQIPAVEPMTVPSWPCPEQSFTEAPLVSSSG